MTPDAHILKTLRSSQVHLPAGEIAGPAGCDDATVKTRIDALREAGYEIDEQPHLGYRLVAAPDRLIADDLAAMLDGCPLAREIIVLEETDSTNNVASQLGRSGVNGGVVVFAEKQNEGRGRLGRKWESAPREGLWFSILLKPGTPIQFWTRFTMWAAVGIAEAIEETTGRKTAIKWPNDLFIDGKKTAGILIESHVDKGGFAVVGIGVNINQAIFPEPISGTATSLRLAAGRTFDRQLFAVAVLRRLEHWMTKIDAGFDEIVAAADARNFLRGQRVEMRSCGETITGIAGNLDETGALIITKPDGSTFTIASGEVTVASYSRQG